MSNARLFVSGLSKNTTDDDLRELFSRFGPVLSTKVWIDFTTSHCKGWGFVEMDSAINAFIAQEALDGILYQGRRLKVNESRT